MCEPVSTAGVSGARACAPRAPKVLPAGSTHVVSPAPRISASSHARASSCGGDQHERVTPPPGRAPNRASALMREVSLGREMAITARQYIMNHGLVFAVGPPSGGEIGSLTDALSGGFPGDRTRVALAEHSA